MVMDFDNIGRNELIGRILLAGKFMFWKYSVNTYIFIEAILKQLILRHRVETVGKICEIDQRIVLLGEISYEVGKMFICEIVE